MSNTILRDSIIIGLAALAVTYAVAHKQKIYELAGLTPAHTGNLETDIKPDNITPPPIKGAAVSLVKSSLDGHFWADARVNSGRVKFLVDTGASSIALTPEDARRAGIRLRELKYNIPISTAGGDNFAARITLKSVSIGPITLRNVPALIVPEGLSTSLLGMSFLGQLQKIETNSKTMILRL